MEGHRRNFLIIERWEIGVLCAQKMKRSFYLGSINEIQSQRAHKKMGDDVKLIRMSLYIISFGILVSRLECSLWRTYLWILPVWSLFITHNIIALTKRCLTCRLPSPPPPHPSSNPSRTSEPFPGYCLIRKGPEAYSFSDSLLETFGKCNCFECVP